MVNQRETAQMFCFFLYKQLGSCGLSLEMMELNIESECANSLGRMIVSCFCGVDLPENWQRVLC